MNQERKRYRRRRKASVRRFCAWNWDAEPGDLMVSHDGRLYRLEESSGWGAASAGILYPRAIAPPRGFGKAIIDGAEVFWTRNEVAKKALEKEKES